MGKVLGAIVAIIQLLWYTIKSSVDSLYREKVLREAAEKRAAELEAQRMAAAREAAEKDRREGDSIIERRDGAAAGDWLRKSFPEDRDP